MEEYALIGAAAIAALFLLLWLRSAWKARGLRKRIAGIVSVEAETARIRGECEAETRRLKGDAAALKKNYEDAYKTYSALREQVTVLEEELEAQEVGLYKPHFDFQDSDAYKREVDSLRKEIGQAVKSDRAAVCGAKWAVGNSSREGERLQKQYLKCMLRAFNGECDAAIAKVSWSNITKMEARMEKAFQAINKLGTVMRMEITTYYLGLRTRELRLVHEYQVKKQREADEQRRLREQMREEERVQRELEREREEAEADERRYQKALDRAREEAAKATGAELAEKDARVKELEQQLAEAHQRGERAVAQAQLTKTGHVYVISNIGSFGDDVVKIGMTRRLDPQERVKELGDASVPFEFDVHAMIYSEDAPALEAAIHRELDQHRVNLVNYRKEFFRAPLREVERVAQQLGVRVELTLLAEAREFKETMAQRAARAQVPAKATELAFPTTLDAV